MKLYIVHVILTALLFLGCQSSESTSEVCIEHIGCQVDTLGSESDDALMQGIHKEIESFFTFESKLLFISESDEANAFATQENKIYFGQKMFESIKASSEEYSVMLMGVMSHEYGHIMQYNVDVNESKLAKMRQVYNVGSSIILSELEADAFSGLYMTFKLDDESKTTAYFEQLERLGDTAFNNVNHHGTSNQRQAAALLGIYTASYIVENDLVGVMDWTDLRMSFLEDIQALILTSSDLKASKRESRYLSKTQLAVIRKKAQ